MDKKSCDEKEFYLELISWLETALTETDVIVVAFRKIVVDKKIFW